MSIEPKEKAIELLLNFGYVVGFKADGITEKVNENAKGLSVEHAIICVDEIIEAHKKYGSITLECPLLFWQQVKEELNKL